MRWYFGKDSESLSYWRMAATAAKKTIKETLADHDLIEPTPIHGNVDAWSAFFSVRMCRHNAMGTPWVANWSDIRTVLELHNRWIPEIQSKVDFCFTEILRIESEGRKLDGPRTR